MGYVFALKNCFPLKSLGEVGVDACMAANAVGVSQVTIQCWFFLINDANVLRRHASRALRSRCKRAAWYEVGSIEGLIPCARARFPPSIPSIDGYHSGARISSDAMLCLCRSACTTTMLPAPTATIFLITLHLAWVFTVQTAANVRCRVLHCPWIRTPLIAQDHRPRSRISYLTTCHSSQNPAATDNWTLSGTLRYTTE